jgi:lipoate---protein ligase
MQSWRLIPFWQGTGRLQMAIDQWLFEQCHAELHPPVLRFYAWTPAAISLGYHQTRWPSHWQSLRWQDQPLDLVRRPTGGRAVLHAGDLTYSLVLPHQSGHRRDAYAYICRFLIEGWRSLNVPLHFGHAGRGYQRQVNCFESATAADLMMPTGRKLIGSAQAWRGQTVLQHGSMQLQANPDLHRQVFGSVPGNVMAQQQHFPAVPKITDALTQAAVEQFGITFEVCPLAPAEWDIIYGRLTVSS